MLIIFSLIILLFSVVIHEISHGSVAYALGDSTAKDAGRLTLNPLKHLDPFGSIILPLLLLLFTGGQGPIFGWARPVPINPYNFRDQKWGIVKVAIAGPAANFLLAIVFGLLIRFSFFPSQFSSFFPDVVFINLLLGLFNLVPISPLDGFNFFFNILPNTFWRIKIILQQYGIFILIFFIFFGLRFLGPLIFYLYKLIVGS